MNTHVVHCPCNITTSILIVCTYFNKTVQDLLLIVKATNIDFVFLSTAKLVPVGYGIKKLQINCVVEDDKVKIPFIIYGVLPPVLFRTNYYSIEILHGVTAIILTYHPHHAKLQVLFMDPIETLRY